jgi:hypothetical protein
MSEADLQMLTAEFERINVLCDTAEKATAQLQSEGLLDKDGQLAHLYREAVVE